MTEKESLEMQAVKTKSDGTEVKTDGKLFYRLEINVLFHIIASG